MWKKGQLVLYIFSGIQEFDANFKRLSQKKFRNSGENITCTKHSWHRKAEKVRKIAIPEFANFKSTHIWELVNRLHHTKSRNRKGYENHVITLYSVVTWFFFYKFFLIFREFKANLTVTWLKCVVFLGYPSLAEKMGKWEK